jgi:hypothetical protein
MIMQIAFAQKITPITLMNNVKQIKDHNKDINNHAQGKMMKKIAYAHRNRIQVHVFVQKMISNILLNNVRQIKLSHLKMNQL